MNIFMLLLGLLGLYLLYKGINFLLIILVIVIGYYIIKYMSAPTQVVMSGGCCGNKDVSTPTRAVTQSCECDVLQGSGHITHINHKARCRRFRELNPNLSWADYMNSEGILDEPGDWPSFEE
jgi:hypothetical protein